MSTTLPPVFLLGGGEGEGRLKLQPNFQKGGNWQDLNFYRSVAGKEVGDIFKGAWKITEKSNLYGWGVHKAPV